MGIGVIYGTTSSTSFDVAVNGTLSRLDYLAVEHEGHTVLCQVENVTRKGGLSYEAALQGDQGEEDKLSASVDVVGYVDDAGRIQTPRTPFRPGQSIEAAEPELVLKVLGLESAKDGANIGRVAGTSIPVRLSMNMLAQKHVSVLAKTGAGKSYTVGVLLEEFLQAGVPLVILDPHGEYGSLRHANLDEKDMALMAEAGLKPRSFDKQVVEYALDTGLNPDAQRLRLEGINLEGHELGDLMGGRLSGGQVGLLYQAIKEVKDHMPSYTLQDIMDAVQQNKSSAKWNVINALEALEGTGVFHIRGTPITELVKPKQCMILNLKGMAPDVQEVAVTRLIGMLWEARKRAEIPPFILVCEEAHNFCPERGVGNAISGPIIRTVASEGRKFGMGLVIVSQRPAKIDKNVLSQCNTQLVLKVTNPNDLKAIVSSVEGITSKTSDEVQRLPIGTALIAGGGLTQPVFVRIRPRVTRHGGHSIDVVGHKAPKASPKPAPKPRSRTKREPAPIRADPLERESFAQDAEWVPVAEEEPPEAPAKPAPRRLKRRTSESSAPAHPDVETEAPPPRDRTYDDADPVRVASRAMPHPTPEPTPPAPRPTPPKEVPLPSWKKSDAPGIQRVAQRVGLVEGRSPEDTIAFIQRLAIQNGRNPDMRVGLYAEISRNVCHEEAPACIRCPLADSCQFHQRLRTERKKNRGGIRRLWNR